MVGISYVHGYRVESAKADEARALYEEYRANCSYVLSNITTLTDVEVDYIEKGYKNKISKIKNKSRSKYFREFLDVLLSA